MLAHARYYVHIAIEEKHAENCFMSLPLVYLNVNN